MNEVLKKRRGTVPVSKFVVGYFVIMEVMRDEEANRNYCCYGVTHRKYNVLRIG